MKTRQFTSYFAIILLAVSPVLTAQDAPSGSLCNLLTQPEKCLIARCQQTLQNPRKYDRNPLTIDYGEKPCRKGKMLGEKGTKR